jgi:type IV pilus assembly protein PilB
MKLYSDSDLYKVLGELEIVPKEKLTLAFNESKEKGVRFEKVLIGGDLISDKNLGRVIADMISVPFVSLSEVPIDSAVLKIIPEVYAKSKKVIAFKRNKDGLHLALANPTDIQTLQFVEKKIGSKVIKYYSTIGDIENALALYSKDVKKAFDEIIAESVSLAKNVKKPKPSIIRIVDTTLVYAYQNKASDVHIEPMDEKSLIRFRIDGILHDIVELPVELHSQIVTRVKVLANLRTDEHQTAQDGKISYKIGTESLDIRVSVVPITDGEKIVMRLLSEKSRQFSLQDLGLSAADLKKIQTAYEKPHGMILATGPTGCGKTTTLYSVLKLMNKRDVNIMTIEDPVEYDIEGVNQIQVNAKTGLTFAKGLRSIVRQDPDIILVGEIRDKETADISVNAAMTGHLVLSTLHTNDAPTSIPRLIDLNIEPFLVATTINVIIAQRLVRKICSKCRVSKEIGDLKENIKGVKGTGRTGELTLDMMGKYFGENGAGRIYFGKGCQVCHNTGYVGRVGIFEVIVIDDKVRKVISEKKDASVIRKVAIEAGMRPMIEDGFEKVKKGVTTIEEVLRVTKE